MIRPCRPTFFPAVLKPLMAPVPEGVRIVRHGAALPAAAESSGVCRLERYQPGTAVSVACLQGPGGTRLLEPCRQRIARRGDRLRYRGAICRCRPTWPSGQELWPGGQSPPCPAGTATWASTWCWARKPTVATTW